MTWAILNWFPSRKVACQTISRYHCILAYYSQKGSFCWNIIMYRYRLHSYQYFFQKSFLLGYTHYEEFDGFYRVEIYGQPCRRRRLWELFINCINLSKSLEENPSDRRITPSICKNQFRSSFDICSHRFYIKTKLILFLLSVSKF